MHELHSQLQAADDRVRSLREDRNRLRRVFESARAAAAETETEATMAAAVSAKETLGDVDRLLEAAQDQQVTLLSRLADMESGRVGGFGGGSGWDKAASRLDLAQGRLRVDVVGGQLLKAQVGPLPRTPNSGTAGITTGNAPSVPNLSPRYLYPALVQAPFSAPGDAVATDYTIEFGGDDISGVEDVERDIDASSPKAEISPTVNLATPTARMFACILDSVPSRVFDSQQALRALLSNQLARQLDIAVDQHVVSGIEGSSPPSDSSGSDLIQKIRNAVSDHRDLGSNPTVIALDPGTAASLDLSTDGPSPGSYIFSPQVTGSGAPIWSLLVRETPSISAPTLVDVDRIGVLYTGGGSVLVDPFGDNMSRNKVSVRVEVEGVFHVRDPLGAFVIDS